MNSAALRQQRESTTRDQEASPEKNEQHTTPGSDAPSDNFRLEANVVFRRGEGLARPEMEDEN